jgi:hypothetical protein
MPSIFPAPADGCDDLPLGYCQLGFDALAIARRASCAAGSGARPSGSVGTESRDHAREDFTTARNRSLA